MKIWLIHLGEFLPIDKNARLFRYGILADMLVERGHYVTRWAPTFVHATKQQRFHRDVTIHLNDRYVLELLYAPGYRRHIGYRRLQFHRRIAKSFLVHARKQDKPDLIITGMPVPEVSAAAVSLANERDIPIIVDIRDLWPDVFVWMWPKMLRPIVNMIMWPVHKTNRYIFRNTTAITAISESYLQWGLRYAGRQRRKWDKVFYMAYKRKVLHDNEREVSKNKLIEMGVRKNAFLVVFFGTLGHQFDIETVIESARYLKNYNNNVQFVICGDGSKLEYYRSLSRDLDNVVFTGWVNSYDIALLMEWAEIGLAPYHNTARMSLPNKPIEYMSGGLPILSSLQGELEILLNEYNCGLTYKAGDVRDFLSKLNLLINNSELRRAMGENSKRLFEEKFSADKVYSNMIDYMEQVVAGFGGRLGGRR